MSAAKLLKAFLFTVLFTGWLTASATQEKYINYANGGSLPADSTVSIRDTGYSANASRIEADYLRQNVIAVSLDEHTNRFIPGAFTAKVYVQYYFEDYDHRTNGTPVVDSFTIRYDTGRSFAVRDYRVFSGIYHSRVRITGITADVSWDVSSLLRISNELYVNRAYRWEDCSSTAVPYLSSTVLAPDTDNENQADEYLVSWGFVLGADEYDLEWTFEDQDVLSGYATPSGELFRSGSSRVSVGSLAYAIPLLYDGVGRLHYRVRPVKIRADGQRVEGQWSSEVASGIGPRYVAFNGFQRKLNWQATTSFAEEGKRKSVVNYLDGSLRSRQTVTKDNTTGKAVIAESLYDYQGRAAIQVLPAPTLSSLVTYAKNFNRSLNGAAYDKDDFDKLDINQAACGKAAGAMKTDPSGAAQYYSPNNPLLAVNGGGMHRYIPDAQGFPFTQTEYTLDNTGRIARQGGVGPAHQLGRHDTRYYYGKPSQEELDGLFGTEVGYAGHYFKNMVRDANGQYSISYVDMHGRTIATALAGTPPDSIGLQALPSNQLTTLRESLLEPGSQLIDGYSIRTSKGLVVPKAGTYTLEYALQVPSLTVNSCRNVPICYDCLYDLNIRVTSDCGDALLDVVVPRIGIDTSTNASGIDSLCNASTNATYNQTLQLAEGSYLITKTLTVRRESLEHYRDSLFLQYNLCKTFQDFVTEAVQEIKTDATCVPDCAACQSALGTREAFVTAYMERMGIPAAETAAHLNAAHAAYQQAKMTCDQLCADSLGDHDALRQELLQDMTPPFGQYARNDSSYRMSDGSNIFYTSGNRLNYQDAAIVYRDEHGNIDYVVNDQGQSVKPNELTVSEFTSAFKPSWAEALLLQHPENCKLNRVLDWAASYRYDEQLKAVDTYEQARQKGFLNPAGASGMPARFGTNGTDPAVVGSLIFSAATLQSALQAYAYNPNAPGNTMNSWTLAYQMAVCPDGSSGCFSNTAIDASFPASACEGDLNMAWRNFRGLYLQIKAQLIYGVLNSQCGLFDGRPYQPAGGAAYDRYSSHFPNPGSLATGGGTGNINPVGQTPATVQAQLAGTQLQELVAANCNGYVDSWMQQLGACRYTDAQWLVLKARLLTICRSGGDLDHIGGASTYGAANSATNSFVLAVHQFNTENSIATTAACNGYLLTSPPPYHAPLTTQVNQTVYQALPNSCLCQNLTTYRADYVQSGTAPGLSFSAYLNQRFGIAVTEQAINALYGQCTTTGTPACNYLAQPVTIPPALTVCAAAGYAPACIDCAKADTLYRNYVAAYPGNLPGYAETDSTQQVNNRLFSRYMNYYTGFQYTAAEYLQFLDSCKLAGPLTDTACLNLQVLLTNYRKGSVTDNCSTAKWKINRGFTTESLAPLCNGVSDGTLHVPAGVSLQDGLEFNFADTAFCLPDAFSVEMKVRAPGTPSAYNLAWGIIYQDGSGQDLNPGKYLAMFLPSAQYPSAANYNLNGTSTSTPALAIDLQQWRILRLEKGSTVYKFYMDDKLLVTVPMPADHVGQRHMRLSLLLFSTAGAAEIDWVRMYNSMAAPPYGKLIYEEHFNSNTAFSRVDRNYGCYNSCQNDFAAYYNQQRGTSLSFSQINALYQQSCGKPLDICRDLTPCEQLTRIRETFPLYYSSISNQQLAGGAYSFLPWTLVAQVPWWQTSRGFYFNQFTNIDPFVYNGTFHFPADYDTITNEPKLFFRSHRPICLQNAYAVEYRIKNSLVKPGGGTIPEASITQNLPAVTYTFGNGANPFIWCNNVDDNGNGGDTWTYFPASAAYSDWMTIRVQVTPDSIRFFINGTLMRALPRQDGSYISKIEDVGLIPAMGFGKEVDYVRLYNSAGQQVFEEDFADHQYASFDTAALCPMPGCEQAFTTYFNETRVGQVIGYEFKTYAQIEQDYQQQCGSFTPPVCAGGVNTGTGVSTGPLKLCGRSGALFPEVQPGITSDCADTTQLAIVKATIRYQAYRDSLRNRFDTAYLRRCLAAADLEQLHLTRPENEYHYTLYYYDQAGNLVQTVPPAGVYRFRQADTLALVRSSRQQPDGAAIVPPHRLATRYRYNSLDQVSEQQTPDAGTSRFWYDVLGRLVLSQNAKQAAGLAEDATTRLYSYTLYDRLGRITEVGEVVNRQPVPDSRTVVRNPSAFAGWLNSYTTTLPALYRRQITRTVYDLAQASNQLPVAAWFAQSHLRNRVSYSQVIDQDGAALPADLSGSTTGSVRAGTYYSYDIHGNVHKLLQHYPQGMMSSNPASGIHQYKLIRYDYDLISGKVNQVSYQPSYVNNNNTVVFPDRFYHRYSYDAENRLTHVYTSRDSVYWELDGRYEYYRHGPLARMVLGHQQVQGLDYAYTLQGWLKGVNGASTLAQNGTGDMGGDGASGTTIARDVFSFGLHYYGQDYQAIGGNRRPFATVNSTPLGADYRPLYNGNISSMMVQVATLGAVQLYNYRYDQLNRLVAMDNWRGYNPASNSLSSASKGEQYRERVSYDGSGNILTYLRNGSREPGSTVTVAMDELTYQYYPGTNRLQRVRDAVAATNFSTDIDDQAETQNYVYDAIGNLVQDKASRLKQVDWNVYGKILQVEKGTGTNPLHNTRIRYSYDAAGNRISKQVLQPGEQGTDGIHTWYVRDAQGNVMSTYTYGNPQENGGLLTQSEMHLYGSSRLGMWKPQLDVQSTYIDAEITVNLGGQLYSSSLRRYQRGQKRYELSNHLGNVLAVISDRKTGVRLGAGSTTASYYEASVISATDYYPFGMTMPGRGSSDLESAGTPDNPTGRLRIEAESSTDRNGTQDEPSGDIGGTQNVIYVNPGNWLNYPVTAPVAGTYVVSFRASNGGSTAGLQVRNSSGTVLATMSIPNTGGWQQYATVTTSVILPAGAQTLQLYCSTNNWNLNWWELAPPGTSSGRRTATGSFLVEAEDYIAQNSITTEASSDVSGTLNTVHSTVGSWADYRITVPVAGTYTVKLRVGSTGSGILKLRNAAGADLATLNLASTGGLQQYTTVNTSVSLSGGTQTLRLYTEGASFTVNRLEIVTPPGTNNYALQLNNHPVNGGGFISDAVNDFTVEFWIKAAGTHQIDVESNSLSNIEGVAGQRYAMFPVHGYGSGDAGMGVSVGTNGVSVYEHADGYMPPLLVWESPTPLADWTHVAIVYRNKQPSLYINGNWVKDGQVSQKNNVYAGLQFPGGHYGGTGGEQMDEVRVWKYARTALQIRDNRQGEIPGTTPGLAGYWPMNEGSGTVLHDISGNGRDIDLSSAGYNNSNWVGGRYTVSNQEDLYRYAFNGQENDNEVRGEGNSIDFGDRSIYDPRLGKFFSVDPDDHKYPSQSPYTYGANNPIFYIDDEGRGPIVPKSWWQGRGYTAGFAAGLVDGAWETIEMAWDLSKAGSAYNPFSPYFYSENAKQIRTEHYEMAKLGWKLTTDGNVRDQVWNSVKDAFGQWWDAVSFQNGKDDAGYQQGKIVFDVVTSLIGVGEAKKLLQTGRLSKEALVELKNSEKMIAALKSAGLCFAAGTKVLTKEGVVNIEDIKVGDSVWAYSDSTGVIELQRVYSTTVKQTKQFVKLLIGSEVVWTTPDHPFWLNRNWVEARYLHAGDSLTLYSTQKQILTNVEFVDSTSTVYNFSVENYHSYYVTELGILTHNTGCMEKLKKPLRYVLKSTDLDWRGAGKGIKEALEEAFKRTGVDRKDFDVTKWGKDINGKSIPVEYRAKNGAEVSIDFSHTTDGPDAPHVGYQTGGKRSSGGAERGHIILDDVPAGRSSNK